ncbi:MAG: 2-dehydropantoate 2-reductase [Chloroflexi bacterium AL-W]|nr:2-dehydropantoate 2-reductase [Chloroflexi bacterium AL-N1]NOK70620.1 2-dehydropantoate 2-reductase [Chloroflexi bacterium AL-N10]NOK77612.1 2-dehydropantoate 2-reductase [Chloroflexi bacterium AL-N5]NOK84463.1 2-dehydropantoate 2-reductase [Chloroflexi bacterium AL-W]NOK92352.1 2-dehydropantoate 2-reductase [Chloroflexi bacterium AL-N15]
MKIAVIGSGGVGGYFGGMLALAGYEVTFVARGAHLRAMRTRGLHIERYVGETLSIAPVDATDDPREIGVVDLVLLTVKSYDLLPLLEEIDVLVGPETTIIPLQNGVESPDVVAATFGATAVLPGLVYSEVSIKEPGTILQGSVVSRIVLGELDGAITARTHKIHTAFLAAKIDVTISDNILGALWSKFCFICAMGGVTTLTRQTLGSILADPEGRTLLITVMEEVRTLGQSYGIQFAEDPVAIGVSTAERFDPDAKSSMLRDLERGNRLELEALNGAAVRLARRHNIDVPANQTIYTAIRLLQSAS